MSGKVHLFYRPNRQVRFVIPPGQKPQAEFQPIRIRNNFLQEIGIQAEDLISANLALAVRDGRFSLLMSTHGYLLGYPFTKPGGWTKMESLCRAPCCPPRYLHATELTAAGPIVRVHRRRGGVTLDFIFNERRAELWET